MKTNFSLFSFFFFYFRLMKRKTTTFRNSSRKKRYKLLEHSFISFLFCFFPFLFFCGQFFCTVGNGVKTKKKKAEVENELFFLFIVTSFQDSECMHVYEHCRLRHHYRQQKTARWAKNVLGLFFFFFALYFVDGARKRKIKKKKKHWNLH